MRIHEGLGTHADGGAGIRVPLGVKLEDVYAGALAIGKRLIRRHHARYCEPEDVAGDSVLLLCEGWQPRGPCRTGAPARDLQRAVASAAFERHRGRQRCRPATADVASLPLVARDETAACEYEDRAARARLWIHALFRAMHPPATPYQIEVFDRIQSGDGPTSIADDRGCSISAVMDAYHRLCDRLERFAATLKGDHGDSEAALL